MAILEITNRTIRVIGLPEEDHRSWLVRILFDFISPKKDQMKFAPAKSYQLQFFFSAAIRSEKTSWPVKWETIGYVMLAFAVSAACIFVEDIRWAGIVGALVCGALEYLLVERNLRPRDYWTLQLEQLNGFTRVIASRDHSAIRIAYDQVHTAMNAPDKFSTNVTIENSTIVMDADVGGDIHNNVGGSEKPKKN